MKNVVVIGSGPAGLTAGLYLARARLEPIIITGDMGGQLMTTTTIENYPGVGENMTGPELITNMVNQAKSYGAQLIYDRVTKIDTKDDGTHVVYCDKFIYLTRAVIIATGADPKYLGLEKEETFKNNGISTCAVCDGALPIFRDKVLAVVGGGDTACEEALYLTRFASKVLLIHRRNTLRASKIMQNKVLNNPHITILWDSEVVAYVGDEFLTGIVVAQGEVRTEYEVGGLFVAIGHKQNDTLFSHLRVSAPYTNETGIFVAGDCVDQTYRQAITAAGFGCQAALACERYLN
jgi:thioredoxin reductase (NADPH)